MSETEVIRQRLTEILTRDEYLSRVFPFTGDLSKAKFSRAKLLLKNASDNGVDLNLALEAALGIEMVHLATLIHDDVIDDSNLRRNEQSFRSVKGDKGAVLYGDYLFSSSVNQIQTTQNQGCSRVFVECINTTCRGEAIQDLLLTETDYQPTLELMHEVARGKTGALFSFCTEAPAWIANGISESVKNALKEIGYLLGLGYQLADDVLDIAGVEENLGKPAGNDLMQNCMTTPLFVMMNHQNLSWNELREKYVENCSLLQDDFLNGESFVEIKDQIGNIKNKLDNLVQLCNNENWEIGGIVSLFWSLYVKKRMDLLLDAKV